MEDFKQPKGNLGSLRINKPSSKGKEKLEMISESPKEIPIIPETEIEKLIKIINSQNVKIENLSNSIKIIESSMFSTSKLLVSLLLILLNKNNENINITNNLIFDLLSKK